MASWAKGWRTCLENGVIPAANLRFDSNAVTIAASLPIPDIAHETMFTVDEKSILVAKIPEVLSAEECQSLIAKIDDIGPEVAPINTSHGTRVRTDVRNNERVMFDDVDLAEKVFHKAEPHVPAEMRSRRLVGANERFRCYRYKSGMRFAPHADGSFERENDKSYYTFLIYLNDDFTGGETNMATQPELSIRPEVGLGLVFQHPIVHEGAEVTSGIKYVARTDLMYRKES